jgi:hypothetical protein
LEQKRTFLRETRPKPEAIWKSANRLHAREFRAVAEIKIFATREFDRSTPAQSRQRKIWRERVIIML